VSGGFERRATDDPWGGRQPRYEKLVMIAPSGFALTARLPSGERIDVPLARVSAAALREAFEIRADPSDGDLS
jgi:hypothetical protein